MVKNTPVRVKKNYESSYGKLVVCRHVYQNSKGGKIFCPLEQQARILQNATPHFAKQVSSKYGEMSALQVQKDLKDNHGRQVSVDYIQKLSAKLGDVIKAKQQQWTYCLPTRTAQTQIIAIGRDGTTMPVRKEGYRETMNV